MSATALRKLLPVYCGLTRSATKLIRLKSSRDFSKSMRKANADLYIKEREALESAVTKALSPLFERQIKSAMVRLLKITGDKAFCPTGPGGGIDNSCPPRRGKTNTPEFKAWFGDSKVVDSEGNPKEQYGPKPVYHGTTAEFTQFRDPEAATMAGKGLYFAENKRIAESYAGSKNIVIEAYLSIQNPYSFERTMSLKEAKALANVAMKGKGGKAFDNKAYQSLLKELDEEGEVLSGRRVWNLLVKSHNTENLYGYVEGKERVNQILQRAGYDGITHLSSDSHGTVARNEEEGDFGRVWVAFKPTQIKSTDNEGTFDPSNPDFTKAFYPTGPGGGIDNSCYSKQGQRLTLEERDAVQAWALSSWGRIKAGQRTYEGTELSRAFDSALEKLPVAETTLYRGIAMDRGWGSDKYAVGSDVMFDVSESFTDSKDWGEGWAVEHPRVLGSTSTGNHFPVVFVMPPSDRMRNLGPVLEPDGIGRMQGEHVNQKGTLTKVTARRVENGVVYIYFNGSEVGSKYSTATKQTNPRPSTLARQIYDPDDWNDELINRLLPPIAKAMIAAAWSQIQVQKLGMEKMGYIHRVKASTATEWLQGISPHIDLANATFNTPYGPLTIRIPTEFPDWMKRKIESLLRESFAQDYWRKVNETTLGDIEGFLEKGVRDGWSIQTMAEEMAPSLLEEGKYALTRAKLIARTESGNTLNGARSASIDEFLAQVGSHETPMQKVWLSILSNTTRDTHANADGVPCDVDGTWLIGGYRCRWPGDVWLPARERCNCYCSVEILWGVSDTEARDLRNEYYLRQEEWEREQRSKAFCPTGPGGGVDNSCSPNQGNRLPFTGQCDFEVRTSVASYLDKFGKTPKDVAALCGAPDGSRVVVQMYSQEDDVVEVEVHNEDINLYARRLISFKSGEIRNAGIGIRQSTRQKGYGTQILCEQVKNAAEHGFKRLECRADKSDFHNGYYTWPRLGFDAGLTGNERGLRTSPIPNIQSATKLSDLMATESGRTWWKENGDSTYVKFDLTEGSRSRQVLADYAREKGLVEDKFYVDWVKAFCPTGPGGGIDNSCGRNRGGSAPVTESEKNLHGMLTQMKEMIGEINTGKAKDWKHRSMESLVLEEGTWDTPQKLPDGVRRGTMKECYKNAFELATSNNDYTYSEGYATLDKIPFPIQHAWVVDKEGRVVDNTWSSPGAAYVGVHVDTEYLLETALKEKVYGIFGELYTRSGQELLKNGLPDEAKPKVIGDKAFCPTGTGGGIDNSCPPTKTSKGAPTGMSLATDDEVYALQMYQISSPDFNEALRKGKMQESFRTVAKREVIEGEEIVQMTEMSYEEMRDSLDGLIGKGVLGEDTLLYRGLPGLKKYTNLEPGDVIKDKAFLSTTSAREEAVTFATDYNEKSEGVVLEIKAKASMHGIRVDSEEKRDITRSGVSFECGTTDLGSSEVLLPRNVNMKVISVRRERVTVGQGRRTERKTIHHVQVEVVG